MGQQTTVEVRAIAAGGKFLGNDIGGAEITVRDATTGEWIAGGRVRGDSGVTGEIMDQPRDWGTPVPVDQSSVFTLTLDLVQPRLLEISAHGPLGSLQSARRVTVQQWVAPGMDLTGIQGVQIVIPGQLVEIVDPPTHTQLSAPGPVTIHANVAMMCGCPMEPGGIWDSTTFQISERISLESQEIAEVPLRYAGQPSQFSGAWTLSEPGFYEAVIYAYQPINGNTGMGRVTFFLPPA